MHYWTTPDGQRWACDAYDHGPFCRLCTKVEADKPTEIVKAIWNDLMGRSGFGSALDDEPEMEQEIIDDLVKIVRGLL